MVTDGCCFVYFISSGRKLVQIYQWKNCVHCLYNNCYGHYLRSNWQYIFYIVLGLFLVFFMGSNAVTVRKTYFNSIVMIIISSANTFEYAMSFDYLSIYAQYYPFIYTLILTMHAYVLAIFIKELTKHLWYPMIMENHPNF